MFAIGIAIFTARLRGRSARADDRRARRRARCAGRSAARSCMPLTLTILSAGVPGERRGVVPRRVGRHQRPRGRVRPARRRRRRQRHLLALDLLAERPARARARCRSRCRGWTRRKGPFGGSTCLASGSRARVCSGSCGGSSAATPSAGARRRSSARSSPAPRSSRVRRVGAARRASDAADALLPQPHVRARERSRRC